MRQDLTGKRFGKLTVLYIDEDRSKNGKVYWYCRCDCESDPKSIRSTALTRKKNGTKSCGCARNSEDAKLKAIATRNKYPQDITGLKFGRLTVIKQTEMVSKRQSDNGAKLWECRCDCGKTCYYSRYSLITPNGVRSCGCLYYDTRSEISKKYCEYDLDTYSFGIGYCNNGTHFFFDKEDYEKIKDYAWWYDGRYVCAHSLRDDSYTTKIIRLHRVVMGVGDREDINIDHKNLVRYDCRKINLRRATDSQNAMNKDYGHLSKTGIVGVKQNKNKWFADIKVDSQRIYLGSFDTLEEATEARIEAEIKYFGEFRYNLTDKDMINEKELPTHVTLKKIS